VLISEVAVRGKDGEPLELPELEAAAAAALRACRPNAALTVREVQEDVHRIVESGLFRSCMPVAVDTRDGIRLVFEVLLSSCCPLFLSLFPELMNAQFRFFFWFQVEPNQDFHGLVCEGANMLPSKFMEDAFRDRHGKHVLPRSQIMFYLSTDYVHCCRHDPLNLWSYNAQEKLLTLGIWIK
jgi:outer membrane protein insertion porin family